eukprot:CAMPEP_0171164326 /NCGR_PEP_ID=MMETSP0790-20130122/5610_1 /TAXON_ID=2925 /ORGANISM="Alexandrium catenella, Strain OF101" /LENGTH=223 /DNA_ID=CAMNT_0011629077 /DNA_START=108 /DNA_END=782 /DNA_ORIENTATION=+
MTASEELQVVAGEADGPCLYRCAQGVLFMKRREDPRSGKILKVSRPVGCLVHCTGHVWTGPSGGQWAELDAGKGEAGWVLVQGPGFGLTGPALVDAGGGDSIHIKVHLLDEDERKAGIVWESLLPKDAKIRAVKAAMCQATRLDSKFCCLSKGLPGMSSRGVRLGADFMPELQDDWVLRECGLGDEATLLLVYVGDFPRGLEVWPAAPPQPIPTEAEKRAGLI